MVQSGMKAPRHSNYSRYSNNTLIGAGHSITPITPAGYYIAAVILEWSECRSGAPVTPDSIIGVLGHRTGVRKCSLTQIAQYRTREYRNSMSELLSLHGLSRRLD